KLSLHYMEKQDPAASGIMLDFDRYQRDAVRVIDQRHFNKFSCIIATLLREFIDFEPFSANDEFKFKVFIIQKPAPAPATHTTYGRCWKDGFHLLIPEIWISRPLKRYLVREIKSRRVMQKAFNDINAELQPLEGMLDDPSSYVPVNFLGSSKVGSKAYPLTYAVEITIDLSAGSTNSSAIPLDTFATRNLSYELSLSSYLENFIIDGAAQPTWLKKQKF